MYGSSSAQMSSGLHRYRSAPMSLLGQLCEDLIPPRPPSPENDSLMLARFLSSDLGVVVEEEEEEEIHEKKNILPPPPPPSSAQLPRQQLMMMTYQQQQHQIQSQNSSSSSSLINRQSSSRASPAAAAAAGLFDQNGYGSMEGYPAMMTTTTTTTTTTPTTSWGDDLSDNNFASGFNTKRQKTTEPTPHQSEREARNGPLNHQFSFPKTSSEMAAIDKFLMFQDSVPCKIRAKRGCATHPRSIAERVRRTRISERMRKLQDLVPNMDKQTNTADMLDLAVDYIKDLQKKVVTLSDNRASCTCSSSKQRQ